MSKTNLIRVINHLFHSWKFHFKLMTTTILVLTASFTVITGVFLLSGNIQRVLTLWGESMQVSVYLKEEINPNEILEIEKYLGENGKIKSPKYVSKNEALLLFQEQMSSYAPDILADKELIKYIPSSFQFGMSDQIPVESHLTEMQELASSLKVMSGVDEVSFGQDWVKNYSSFFKAMSWLGLFFIIVVIASASFVMAHTIQTSIYQRKQEIEVLELVGATSKYIRLPFLWEGAILGGTTSIFAVTTCYGLYTGLKHYFQQQISFFQIAHHIQFIQLPGIFGIIVFGFICGGLISWLCVRNVNNGWASVQQV